MRPPPSASSKAAILSALAVFDADDDEHDDTYDAEDVGGTVDSTADADGIVPNDETLFQAYRHSPAVFTRDPGTRRSDGRRALRSETGLTDEALEGWAVMIQRDPRRLHALEARFETFARAQPELGTTAWRAGEVGYGGGHGEGPSVWGRGGGGGRGRSGRGGGRGRGRGRGKGRGGGGGAVTGSSSEQGTSVARQRKEASKGSRANHSRRGQRAKKTARAGFGT